MLGQLEKLVGGLRLFPVDAALDYRDAATAYRAVRAMLVCLIAAVAVRTGVTLVHRDRDFDLLASALPDLHVRPLV